MANVTETSTWESGIYQLENTDPVEGGAFGISNTQARQLGNRTRWIKDQMFPGELKWLNGKDTAFILANFPSGLGVGIYSGWAVANGTNGTTDMTGLVAIGQGTGYSVNSTGGNKDSIVPAHSHILKTSGRNIVGVGTIQIVQSGGETSSSTESAGTSGTNANMQPYRSILCIQKI